MDYKGVIIKESLTDASIIKELKVLQKNVEKITEKENTPWLDKWTMYTVVIDKDKIDYYTKQLSKLIDNKHCDDWYCDFRNNEFHYVVFKGKVFKLNRKRKQDYLDMQNYAVKRGLPKHQLPTFNDLPTSLLTGFLIDAKTNSYANSNSSKAQASRLKSKDYHYEADVEGEVMIYHDTFFGGNRFMGEEVVYRGDIPKWGMNYYGITIDESLNEEAIDKALRPALMKVGEDDSVLPVRGPSLVINNGYVYKFKSNGTMDNFDGVEEIYKDEKLIYILHCHGGNIE